MVKCTLIQVENRCYVLKRIIKADVMSWFCGRNHYKCEEFCTIGNYCGCELCTLICTRRECELNFLETATSIGFHGTNDVYANSLPIWKLLWLQTNSFQVCILAVYLTLCTDLYT